MKISLPLKKKKSLRGLEKVKNRKPCFEKGLTKEEAVSKCTNIADIIENRSDKHIIITFQIFPSKKILKNMSNFFKKVADRQKFNTFSRFCYAKKKKKKFLHSQVRHPVFWFPHLFKVGWLKNID